MSSWQRNIPFQVDIAGVIEIMGSSLYSRADTPIRELIQNAHDAVQRRRNSDLSYQGRIDICQDSEAHTISFQDDGIGLTAQEAEAYLGTLGIGMTGLIKRGVAPDQSSSDSSDLIGQFGIGLFSGFMLAERMVVESRPTDQDEGIRWEAGPGTDVTLSSSDHDGVGTKVILSLKPDYHRLAEDEDLLRGVIQEFADFLPIPIYLNGSAARVNVINASWLDSAADRESVELELESCFGETPLDVIPIRMEKPESISGALYISPQRVPGFSESATLLVTVRRMVISRQIHHLLPEWAMFVRGAVELHGCAPTASREDLVRNAAFERVRTALADRIYEYLEQLAQDEPDRLSAILNWHRYTFAGAALNDRRLRDLLRKIYTLPTSAGPLSLDEILARSPSDPLFEEQADCVVWYNMDRRQERWMNQLFAEHQVPCVHTFRSFEESLLAAVVADENEAGRPTALRMASASAPHFAEGILGIRDMEEVDESWHEFLSIGGARLFTASFSSRQAVMAFLNERYELARTFEDLKQEGSIPAGFQRLIDSHFDSEQAGTNEVVLNRNHPVVKRSLSQRTGTPMSGVLRLLVAQALNSAGASVDEAAHRQQMEDLEWIAEALWGRDS